MSEVCATLGHGTVHRSCDRGVVFHMQHASGDLPVGRAEGHER